MRQCDSETNQWELCIAGTRNVICAGTRNQLMDLYDEFNDDRRDKLLDRKLTIKEWRGIVTKRWAKQSNGNACGLRK